MFRSSPISVILAEVTIAMDETTVKAWIVQAREDLLKSQLSKEEAKTMAAEAAAVATSANQKIQEALELMVVNKMTELYKKNEELTHAHEKIVQQKIKEMEQMMKEKGLETKR